ncbi:MAG: alpha/beta hydrolase [Patescibacteria group bacterium]|nr:alpha/beta hydrolase [Patescibacteria group bacterium]
MSSTTAKIPQVVEDIRDALAPHFGDNLLSILLYGSSQTQKTFWDLDILIILKEKKDSFSDLSFLQTVVTTFAAHDLDLQLFYSREIDSADSFSLDAHGAFFSKVLANASVVYGVNPFIQFPPAEELVTISLLNRIQRYIFQVRREYIGMGRQVRDKNPHYHQKHLRRVLLDLMLMVGPCDSVEQAEESFKKHFPNAFTDSQWELLSSDSDIVADYIELYEKMYDIALEVSHTLLPNTRRRPNRTSIQGTVCEYLLPDAYTDVLILVDGLPRVPELGAFMNLLSSWGYAVFYPRLRGTWESEGEFLDHDPAEDIRTLAHHLRKGLVLQGHAVHTDRVLVLGTSFGGLVALGASLSENVALSIALSPVYAMSAVSNIDTLGSFIKEGYGGAYRCTDDNWKNFIRDEILSLEKISQQDSFDPAKCAVIAGEVDPQVNSIKLSALCAARSIPFHTLPLGHLSFHKDTIAIRSLLHTLIRGHS